MDVLCASLRLDEGDFVAEKHSLMHLLDQYQTIFGFLHLPPCAHTPESDILRTRSPERAERRSLKTGSWKLKRITTRMTRSDGEIHPCENYLKQRRCSGDTVRAKSVRTTDDGGRRHLLLSVYGRTTDALASGGYEGRGRLR